MEGVCRAPSCGHGPYRGLNLAPPVHGAEPASCAQATGVPYDEMLFFDDSAWSDHCSMVEKACVGVVTQRTPRGMQEDEWRRGLDKYAEARRE